MVAKIFISEQAVAGWLLILGGLIFLPGGLLYTARVIFKWSALQSRGYLYLERGFVMAAILVAALGFVLLGRLLVAAGDGILSSIGVTIFLIGAVLVMVNEPLSLSHQDGLYALTVVFVVLIFLSQAAFGVSVLLTGILPGWVGWATIFWNLAWLVILPIARPHDMYYPWLFYVAPLLIGITLL